MITHVKFSNRLLLFIIINSKVAFGFKLGPDIIGDICTVV